MKKEESVRGQHQTRAMGLTDQEIPSSYQKATFLFCDLAGYESHCGYMTTVYYLPVSTYPKTSLHHLYPHSMLDELGVDTT